jgi:DNA-binding MarR family transcriptional regulator/GNAT superfamily N-acetyltransferase
MPAHTESNGEVGAIRRFNRFYTRQIGLLDEGFLNSDFSLTEGRVLYELAHRDGVTASELCRDLGLDAGYLSRILKKFALRGIVDKSPSRQDARQTKLALTRLGVDAFRPLNQTSEAEIAGMIGRLGPEERRQLVAAMATVERLLTDDRQSAEMIIRPHKVGDIGWIIRRQGQIYAEDYGWDGTYEALVAEILAAFIRDFDAERERAWIAERDGEIVGSVFLVRKSDEVAKLRLLYVEPSARGIGLGGKLVGECIAFARAKGYRTLTLWTNDILVAARRIYEAAGFRLTAEEKHHSFGKDLVGQTWDLDLRPTMAPGKSPIA